MASNSSDDIQAAGSDTRPPMLDRTDYESWAQRIRLYCLGKEKGANILKSIDEGPFHPGFTRDTVEATDELPAVIGPDRLRTYNELTDEEKKRFDADVRASNIIIQGLPKDVYKLINYNTEAKAVWDNVKMLLAGSELTKEDRESQLYDEFEHFKMNPGESITDYYVKFHKLVNDMRIIKMTMPNIQLNSKFVNNMAPEWDRFVTSVKLNKGLRDTNHEQLYAYLQQHEKHATYDRVLREKLNPPAANDSLAFVTNVQQLNQSSQEQSQPQQLSSRSTTMISQSSTPSSSTSNTQLDSGYSHTDMMIDNLSNQVSLLVQQFRAGLPLTNNQLRTSSNPRSQAIIEDGRVVVQNVPGR